VTTPTPAVSSAALEAVAGVDRDRPTRALELALGLSRQLARREQVAGEEALGLHADPQLADAAAIDRRVPARR
jgi:hypothetical protein